MPTNGPTCCFTGHRPNRLPWLDDPSDLRTAALTRALWERIAANYRAGYTRYLTGMALGVDLICARLVLQLRQEAPEVELVPVLPYPGQASRWPLAMRREHQEILRLCREQIVIISPRYTRSCFLQRNRYLVDHAEKIIGVYDGRPRGGTFQTLEYARQQGIEMELLMPG